MESRLNNFKFTDARAKQELLQEYFIPYYKLIFNCIAEQNIKVLRCSIPKFMTRYQLWKYLRLPKLITDRIYQSFKHQELHYFGINSFLDFFEVIIVSSLQDQAKFLFKLLEVQDTGYFTLSQCSRVFATLQSSMYLKESRPFGTYEFGTFRLKLAPYFRENSKLSLEDLVEVMDQSSSTPFHEVSGNNLRFLPIQRNIQEQSKESWSMLNLWELLNTKGRVKWKVTCSDHSKSTKQRRATITRFFFKDKRSINSSKVIYIGFPLTIQNYTVSYKRSMLHVLRLVSPHKTTQFYYSSQRELQEWKQAIMDATNYRELESEYSLEKVIGKGSHSIVFRGRHKETDKIVAIKAVERKFLQEREFEIIEQEREILSQCQHQNIVRLQDFFESSTTIYLVQELVEGITLKNFKSERMGGQAEVLRIAKGIVNGLVYLKERGIAHRDLKPQNILLDSSDNLKPVIIDFGLSKQLGEEEYAENGVGSPHYLAPQVVSGYKHNQKADIFSLGCIMFELIYGRVPFDKKSKESIFSSLIYESPDFQLPKLVPVSDGVIILVQKILSKDPFERPSIQEIHTELSSHA